MKFFPGLTQRRNNLQEGSEYILRLCVGEILQKKVVRHVYISKRRWQGWEWQSDRDQPGKSQVFLFPFL